MISESTVLRQNKETNRRRWLAAGLLLGGAAFGQSPCTTPGDICYIQHLQPELIKYGRIPAAASLEDLQEMLKGFRAHDDYGFRQMQAQRRVIILNPRNKVRILGSGDGWIEGRVMGSLMDGSHIWILPQWIGPTQPKK